MKSAPLSDVKVPVHVVLGETELTVDELSRLSEGALVELQTRAGEPVQLRVGDETIAEGEVVVIDEIFGLRVTAVAASESVGEAPSGHRRARADG